MTDSRCPGYTASNERMIMNDEFGNMKESAVDYFKVTAIDST